MRRRRSLREDRDSPQPRRRYAPRQIFGEGFGDWWRGLRWWTKAAIVITGIIVLGVVFNQARSPGSNYEPVPAESTAVDQHLTAEMMSNPEFRAGWDELFRLHWNNQASEACNVVKQAIVNQGGVHAAWEALHRQAGDDPQITYEYFAGMVMACYSIFEQ